MALHDDGNSPDLDDAMDVIFSHIVPANPDRPYSI